MIKCTIAISLLMLSTTVRAAEIEIAFLHWPNAPEYHKNMTWLRLLGKPTGMSVKGAEVGIQETRFALATKNVEFILREVPLADPANATEMLLQLRNEGVKYALLDLPTDSISNAARTLSGQNILLFNISSGDDQLRGEDCQPNLLHTLPSYNMQHDALAQFLVTKGWREVLLLIGPLSEDKIVVTSFRRSVKRYGLNIVEERDFVLSNDPREREKANVALLSKGDYDVVFVADSQGEFARTIPYTTLNPRPVLGSEGMHAGAWHWSWERHGAPQLNNRFERKANRRMGNRDWAAWVAIKSLAEAFTRSPNTDFRAIADYLQGNDIVIDGFKGNRLSYRPWDGQLRQPLLLHTHNMVVERAPLTGFLHPTDNLDTIGTDMSEKKCKYRSEN